VERLALTLEQVQAWQLPTRPPKPKDPEAGKWGDKPAVELDAAPPERLTELVDNAIGGLVEPHAWNSAKRTEEEERRGFEQLAATFNGGES
jgi:hypothetical protein